MRQPIDLLFQAWMQRKLDLYLHQFDPEVVQTGRLKSGAAYSRGLDEIAQRRRGQFARLDRVDVLKYEVMFQGIEGRQATFGVRYSMDFFWRDGKVDAGAQHQRMLQASARSRTKTAG